MLGIAESFSWRRKQDGSNSSGTGAGGSNNAGGEYGNDNYSYNHNDNNIKSTLAGVVMRRDLVIDGMVFGSATIEGDDATEGIVAMHRSLGGRTDISCIMLDGLVLSMYNIVDGEQVASRTGLPVIAITFEDSAARDGLERSIRHRFANWQHKVAQYQKLGARERVTLRTGKSVFIRRWGEGIASPRRAVALINAFTLQGSIPEPIRVAKLAARSSASFHHLYCGRGRRL